MLDTRQNPLQFRRVECLSEIVGHCHSEVTLPVTISGYENEAIWWSTRHERLARMLQELDGGLATGGCLPCKNEVFCQFKIVLTVVLSQLNIVTKFSA